MDRKTIESRQTRMVSPSRIRHIHRFRPLVHFQHITAVRWIIHLFRITVHNRIHWNLSIRGRYHRLRDL